MAESHIIKAIQDELSFNEIKKIILSNPSKMNEIDMFENSILHVAIRKDRFEVAVLLVMYGAEVNSRCLFGNTPLMDASHAKCHSLVELLIKKGAHINIENIIGETALIHAIRSKDEYIVNELLKNGAYVNMPGCLNQTPLMYSVYSENIDIVKLLLSYGANHLIKNSLGKTAYDISGELGEIEMMALLDINRAHKSNQMEYDYIREEFNPPTHYINGSAILRNAVINNDMNMVVEVLKKKPKIHNKIALMCSCVDTGNMDIFNVLVEYFDD